MKRLLITIRCLSILIFLLVVLGCQYHSSGEDISSISDNYDSSSFDDSIDFHIEGKYVCSSSYFDSDFFIKHPDSIPSIIFNEDGSCKLFVNYLEGGANVMGIYTIENKCISVKLDLSDTVFVNKETHEKYMDDQYVFTMVNNNEIIIDKGFYAVNAGDSFIKQE